MKGGFLKRKTALRPKSKSEVALTKDRIQKLLREIAIKIYGTCVLADYPEAGPCGTYREDGELIVQAEHLNTRERNISFSDMRNIVLLCKNHHFYFKKQYGRLYWELIRKVIGEKRWEYLKRVEADKKSYNMSLWDWKKCELALN